MSSFQIFTEEEKANIRRGGKILRACLDHVSEKVRPGITTGELDRIAEEFIRSHLGATPAFQGYHGYPSTLCTSVNEQCVHGLPGERVLVEGDVISLDGGVLYEGLYTDACVTGGVGNVSPEVKHLMEVSEKALNAGVKKIKAGARTGDISAAIQKTVETAGLTIVKPLTGHGLGKTLHQFPDIPNFGKPNTGPVLPANTCIAIEPIVSISGSGIREMDDHWTIVTNDLSLSAHYEHTILITDNGYEIIA